MLCHLVFGRGHKDIFTVSSFWDSSDTGKYVCVWVGGGGALKKGCEGKEHFTHLEKVNS